jgi:hypothetical protein
MKIQLLLVRIYELTLKFIYLQILTREVLYLKLIPNQHVLRISITNFYKENQVKKEKKNHLV